MKSRDKAPRGREKKRGNRKKRYTPPRLSDYGTVREITAGGSDSRRDSRGGSQPG